MVGNFPDSKNETLRKKGVKLKRNAEQNIRFIGQDARTPFLDVTANAAIKIDSGNDDFAAFGDFYSSGVYQKLVGSTERTYEDVYGNNDYTNSAGDPTIKQALDEVFGNVEGQAGTETGLTENTLIQVVGQSSALPNRPSLREQGNRLARAQNGLNDFPDESTEGIRGVEEFDAPIESVV